MAEKKLTEQKMGAPRKPTPHTPTNPVHANTAMGPIPSRPSSSSSFTPTTQPPLTKQITQPKVTQPKKKGLSPGDYFKSILGGGGAGKIIKDIATPNAPLPPTAAQQTLSGLEGLTQADILLGKVSIPDIDTSDTNKDWVKFREKNPGIARAITDKQNLEYQKLLKQAEQGDEGTDIGMGAIDPMAVQLLFQNSINPFLQSVVSGANSQTQNYQGMMNQLMNSSSLPEPYRNVLRTQVPQQVSNMNNLTTALAGYTATSPSIQSLMSLLNKDYQAQQQRIAEQRAQEASDQSALTGQLFSSILGQ